MNPPFRYGYAGFGGPINQSAARPGPRAALNLLCVIVTCVWAAVAGVSIAGAQTLSSNQVWRYTLLEGSVLVDDCLACGRPTIELPMRGTFDLRLIEHHPLHSRYIITNIVFSAGGLADYKVTGHGEYEQGGEVALTQRLSLHAEVDDGHTNRLCVFTNTTFGVSRSWPMIHSSASETDGNAFQYFHLTLAAAPVTEFWFSTANGLTPGAHPQLKYVSEGDFVSMDGRVVKRNHELSGRLGIMPVVPDLGLDAVHVLPKGEIGFSTQDDILSELLGQVRHGDILSDRGRVIAEAKTLTAAFTPGQPAADVGTDAAQIRDDGEILFSVETDFFSETLGVTIGKGDLLSSRGVVVASNQQLLAAFSPADPKQDYGLDALHIWPSGEIWFSVETGFSGPHGEAYTAGDLLSDRGYVVFRNFEMVGAFAPLEDLADFGLDSLFLVSDAMVDPDLPAPALTGISVSPGSGDIALAWDAPGRVFQVETAPDLLGPWRPLAPISPETGITDPGAVANSPLGFFRLRQW